MFVVTDSGTDLCLSGEEAEALNIQIVPLTITLDGNTYREGIDIRPDEFFALLAQSQNLPITSQPSPGDFAETYRHLATRDPNILSIHMSSGLSGTLNAARMGAQMVPEANVTVVDTKTLGAGAGWQVRAAARALRGGWSLASTVHLIQQISDATDTLFTLRELKYLIHGGRISHMKGLIASVLDLKPLITVEKQNGTYVQRGQARSFRRALAAVADLIAEQHPNDSRLQVQAVHSSDPEGLLCCARW